ncbi:hypothetical protein [Moorena sp. SIO4G3]|uniref:hypothetical protein n=1 Tax=Moorena sp. SIO4G3 TaxID=2607821 RepID=UPI00142ADE68|nr:hypothetical protein [Moorena sp. SIO4G3]NEO80740.1 hypothetical protein [Moorena sp. SIO4G3]
MGETPALRRCIACRCQPCFARVGETPVRPLHRLSVPPHPTPHTQYPTPEVKVKNLPL